MTTEQLKPCPHCGKPLKKVTQSRNSMLNSDQFDAARLGDYFCDACPETGESYRYFWDRDLTQSAKLSTQTARPEAYRVPNAYGRFDYFDASDTVASHVLAIAQPLYTHPAKTELFKNWNTCPGCKAKWKELSDNAPLVKAHKEFMAKEEKALQSGIGLLDGRPHEQNAVQTERPSLSDAVTLKEILAPMSPESGALFGECLSAQRQDSDKELLGQKWAVWYDGSEGHDPGYCRSFSQGIHLYDSEEDAKRTCTRLAYSPKPLLIYYAAIANGAPK